jgi:hypothetical protein
MKSLAMSMWSIIGIAAAQATPLPCSSVSCVLHGAPLLRSALSFRPRSSLGRIARHEVIEVLAQLLQLLNCTRETGDGVSSRLKSVSTFS